MTYLEIASILSKQWANVNDIKVLASCGRDNATSIRNIINDNIIKQGYNLPISRKKLVPMDYVAKYLNLNVNYIFDMAEKEKKLKRKKGM